MQNTEPVRRGFLLSRHSQDHRGQAEVIMWVVTDDGPARLVIEEVRPVCFVVSSEFEPLQSEFFRTYPTIEAKPLPLKNFRHEPVTALYSHNVQQSFQMQEYFRTRGIELLEADVRLADRFLMERFVYGGVAFTGDPVQKSGYREYRNARIRPAEFNPDFKVVSLDIECSERGELYSVGLSGGDFGRVIMVGDQERVDWIQWVPDEKALLVALEETLGTLDPDIVIGWNVINFDFRLLLKRAERYGMKLKLGRGQQAASWRNRRGESGQGFITLPGRMVIDGIEALKAATYQFDSFSLEFVAQTLLGKGKATEDVDNRMAIINHDFHHNKEKLARYNLQDCRLVEEIFEHTNILDYLRLRSHLTGLELDRMGGSVQAFTNLYMPRLHRAGYVAPNLPEGGGLASPGGYVMDSIPGLYRNVIVLDFKSLYPSIIRTFKIDPLGLVEGLKEPEGTIPGFRGALFSRERHFLPDIIASFWAQRDEAKKQNDAARSQALKIIMNSFYGVLGSGGCRFYDTRLASSITLRGHEIMQQTARWIEGQGYRVIYGDTDSTFVLLDEAYSDEQARSTGKKLERMINDRWTAKLREDLQLDSALELEFETCYQRFLMPTIRGSDTGSKKRYAGIKSTAGGQELVFKGLETVRSDWTALAKYFQTELFSLVFNDQSPEKLVTETVQKTLAGAWDDKLVYRKRLRRNLKDYVKNIPPQVRAARKADEINQSLGKSLKYQRKGWIQYLMTVNGPEPLEYCTSPIDYQHYIDKQLKPVADGVLPFINLDFNTLIDGQMGLF
ncbi:MULTISPECIES: DNA polymerase II [unclassified Endozoicomonas]|uniref:DNA polymerase II n=1 Tax=unclassified Endozoicomonas TaxID=2644528 RepID=UPI0021485481|nr:MULTISPECIES: DNA polymerase II [unclassified Endozoicomonas]